MLGALPLNVSLPVAIKACHYIRAILQRGRILTSYCDVMRVRWGIAAPCNEVVFDVTENKNSVMFFSRNLFRFTYTPHLFLTRYSQLAIALFVFCYLLDAFAVQVLVQLLDQWLY